MEQVYRCFYDNYQVFDHVAEWLQLTRSQFLIVLMVQNGVIQGGLECIIPDPEYQAEWRHQLIERHFPMGKFIIGKG